MNGRNGRLIYNVTIELITKKGKITKEVVCSSPEFVADPLGFVYGQARGYIRRNYRHLRPVFVTKVQIARRGSYFVKRFFEKIDALKRHEKRIARRIKLFGFVPFEHIENRRISALRSQIKELEGLMKKQNTFQIINLTA